MPHACLCRTAHRSLSLGFAAALRTSGRCAARNETSAGLRTWGPPVVRRVHADTFWTARCLSLDLPRLGHPRPTALGNARGLLRGRSPPVPVRLSLVRHANLQNRILAE